MKLIIAEKPSLGRNIADAIGNMQKQNGYFQNNEYIVTWVFGHLFSLADIEYYSPKSSKTWSFENIPCFPSKFDYLIGDDAGIKKQFSLISTLCNRGDVSEIINAGDADREGEIIVRTTVGKALKSDKPQYRLWLPDQTAQTVREALSNLELDSNYDLLANEGYARTYIDWLYGVNLTRYASILTGKLLRVGRVIVPIVKAIYDRDLAIRNFVSEKYYGIASKTMVRGEEVLLNSKKEFSKDELDQAKAYAKQLNDAQTKVTDKKSKEDFLPAPKLYSLSTLQNVLGKKYKMSMKESLDLIQGLYEKGYLTYPRTNSEYLATAEKGKVRAILDGVSKLGYDVAFKDSKYIFDDSKIESHSALTPTYKIPSKDALNEKEKNVYSTVLRRFVAVFCKEPCKVEKSEITIKTGDLEEFVLKGMVLLQPGWTKYDEYTKKDKVLPNLQVGEIIETQFEPVEKETTAPKHYTIETLNNYLKNPFKEEKANAEDNPGSDDEDYRAIFEGLELGTEATRTGIIDNARQTKYIDLNKDVYTILPGGEFLIESLISFGISMDKYKTSELGKALKKVYHGEMTVEDSTKLAQEEIQEIFSHKDDVILQTGDTVEDGTLAGNCPICGNQVKKNGRYYRCEKEDCTFRIASILCKKALPLEMVQCLLATSHTPVIDGFVSKKGTLFSAPLKLDENNVVFDLADPQENQPIPNCKCPSCGKKMIYSRFSYNCSVKKCGFSIGKKILGHEITEEELHTFVENGIVGPIEMTSKNGDEQFKAYLILVKGKAIIAGDKGSIPNHDMPKNAPTKKEKAEKKSTTKKTFQIGDVVSKCPFCGDKIVLGQKNFGCLGYKNGCKFILPYRIKDQIVNPTLLGELLSKGTLKLPSKEKEISITMDYFSREIQIED